MLKRVLKAYGVTLSILMANVIVFAYIMMDIPMLQDFEGARSFIAFMFSYLTIDLINNPHLPILLELYGGMTSAKIYDGEIWRFLTSNFVHFRMADMLFPMVVVGIVGARLERYFTRGEYLTFIMILLIMVPYGYFLNQESYYGLSGLAFGMAGALVPMLIKTKMKHKKSISSVYSLP